MAGLPYREQGESAVNDGGIGIENVAAEKKGRHENFVFRRPLLFGIIYPAGLQ